MIIRTPRRLHMGLIDPSGSLGRRFGSLGVAIEGGYEVRITPSDSLEIKAGGEDRETIIEAVNAMNGSFETGTGYSIEVREGIPRHVGLGSTTQLSLAVGTGIARLSGLNVTIEEIARVLGRGKNSGVGIHAFRLGGFVLDGGVRNGVPPLIVRHDFPEEWAFLVITPELQPGFDEREEKPVMASLGGNPKVAREISHLILLGLLPALVERNIRDFGRSLTRIQELVGSHFSNYQGGEFREDVGILLDFLREKSYGYGQSSWGPTVYGLILRDEGEKLVEEARDYMNDHGIGGTVEIGVPRNRGAEIIQENAFLERLIKSVGNGQG
jgi:beta-ribofuranosylaminobenzene 5'-phosphate synthase